MTPPQYRCQNSTIGADVAPERTRTRPRAGFRVSGPLRWLLAVGCAAFGRRLQVRRSSARIAGSRGTPRPYCCTARHDSLPVLDPPSRRPAAGMGSAPGGPIETHRRRLSLKRITRRFSFSRQLPVDHCALPLALQGPVDRRQRDPDSLSRSIGRRAPRDHAQGLVGG